MSAPEEWSETVKLIISNRINSLQHRTFLPCKKILEDPHINGYLTELQTKYVLVPADKAGNNIIFVCKYYYLHTLMEELGINSDTNFNSTYVTQDRTVDEIIQTHATRLEDVFDIKLQQREKKLATAILHGFLNFTRHHIGQNFLQVQAHAQRLGFLN